MLFQKVGQLFAEAAFPLFCVVCDREGALVCDACACAERPVFRQACPYCTRTTPYGAACVRHACDGALDGVIAITSYADARMKSLIRLWKYQFVREAIPCIEREITRFVSEHSPLFPFDEATIVPVPLHPRRARARGFDQALETARLLSDVIGYSMCDSVLCRTRYTSKHQADIEQDALRRTHIVSSHFRVNINLDHMLTSAVLVDDVYTTGATMQAAAAVLKIAGTKTVWGFVLARG